MILMKPNKSICLLVMFALLGLAGCETTPSVRMETAPTFDAQSYETFAILDPEDNPLTPGASSHYRTIRLVMTSALRSKGLSESAAGVEEADLVFQAAGGSIPMVSPSQYGFLWVGDGWFWYPHSYRRSNMNSQSSGMIVVNAFDTRSKELVWQGVSQSVSTTGGAASQSAVESLKAIMATFPAR